MIGRFVHGDPRAPFLSFPVGMGLQGGSARVGHGSGGEIPVPGMAWPTATRKTSQRMNALMCVERRVTH